MEYIELAAAAVVGLALGLFFGRLLNAVLVHWEGSSTAVKASIAATTFLLGGGGGAALFAVLTGAQGPAFYLLSLGIGMLAAFFLVKVAPRYSLGTFLQVVQLSEALREKVPGLEQRALLILATFAPPKAIEQHAGLPPGALARKLEQATDVLESSGKDAREVRQ